MAAGDVVNTAARLQAAAPVNGILVGERTFRATRAVIEYREAEPVAAKGKKELVPVWEALQARARFGVEIPHQARTALVGRERELHVLRDALARVRAERTPQLVTLVGVPGIGKSRLLYELSRIADAEAELISMAAGPLAPYGEGVSFWALAEMVKAQAGILESDTAGEAGAKLAEMTADVVSGARTRTGFTGTWVRWSGLGRRRIGRRRPPRRGVRRLAAFLRSPGRAAAAGARVRGSALGGRRAARLRRLPGRLCRRVPAAGGRYRAAELLARRPGWGGGKPNAVTCRWLRFPTTTRRG